MSTIHVKGTDLYYEIKGNGPPLVLVHGSWVDHTNWLAAAALLAESFRVVTYDRRGHSRSGRPADLIARRQHEDDLAALLEVLECSPAHVAGNSFGGLVALGLAARRPELARSITVHEPPALSAVEGGELARRAAEVTATLRAVIEEVETGHVERGTRRFIEEVALGPGSWELLPEPMRATCMRNAPAFVAEERDPGWSGLDTDALNAFTGRILLTTGDAAPLWLRLLVDRIAVLLPAAQTATIAGAGHAPHLTHPAEYAELVTAFLGDRTSHHEHIDQRSAA